MREGDPTVEFRNVTCKRETDAALLVEIDDKEIWMPKSQISDDSEVTAEDDVGTLIVSQWIAEQKGLV